jgi:hypothetical protein
MRAITKPLPKRLLSLPFAVLSALGAGLLLAEPAAADAPRPTDYRSTVDAIVPQAVGVHAQVVGGDAFLEVTTEPGHEVVVDGYQGEPYLRFGADGTVERNRLSPATYLNESRSGTADVPAGVDDEAEPDWEVIDDDGSYAWHDHRIHWMGGDRPGGAVPGEWTRDWTVDVVVDGTNAQITGTLALEDGASPLPWIVVGVAAAAALAVVGRRRPAVAGAAGATVAAAVALVLGWAQYAAAPAGSGPNLLLVAVPAAGLVAAAIGLVLAAGLVSSRRVPASAATVATLAGAAAVLGWGVLRAATLWKPVLPTELPYALDRAGTALAMGLAAAAAGLVVWAGGVRMPTSAEPVAIVEGGGRR